MNQLFNQPCQCLDFAVSWDFYRSHCWEVHGYDPGPDRLLEPDEPYRSAEQQASTLVATPPEPPWSREQWQSVQQLRAMVLHLNNKVTEMRAKKKPRGQY